MTDKIKHVSELPRWFKLDKYNDAKNLDANGWYEQLCIRGSILKYFDHEFLDEVGLPKTMPQQPCFKEALKDVREKPIFDINGEEKGKLPMCFYFDSISTLLKSKHPKYGPSVYLMTLEEFDVIKRGIDPDRLEYARHWKNQFIERAWESLKPPYKYESWIKEPVYNSVSQEIKETHGFTGIDPVIVNLQYSDKILLENFKQYLAVRRAELKEKYPSKQKQCNFADWVRYGVLPYLDLKIWEVDAGIKIPYRVIADAIYPLGEGGEETVRKTTIPLVDTILNGDLTPHLLAQAAIESAERVNK
jgi:hypothetical protein